MENYQFPLIADERQTGSTLLQRLVLVDVATDREVWMLYSSFMRALGPGLIWAYGHQAPAIGVGTTGGGPDIPGSPQMPSLSWEELAGDLRLARHFCDQILIHSLEGCVWQGFLGRLRSFEWADVAGPPRGAGRRCPSQGTAGNPVGKRASQADAGHHIGLGLAHLALAPKMTISDRPPMNSDTDPAEPGPRRPTPSLTDLERTTSSAWCVLRSPPT